MGSAPSKQVDQSQAPAKCGVCRIERPIKWKCITCDNLMCNHCKEYVHPKFKHSPKHQVVNIKDLDQPSVLELKINKQYETELSVVTFITSCHDDSLWICWFKDKVLQRVKPEETKLKVLTTVNIGVYGMAFAQPNGLLIANGERDLKHISIDTGELTDSIYNMPTLRASAVHITSDNKILVGCTNEDFPKEGSGVVILMNYNGDHEKVYEQNEHKKYILTYPWQITSTINWNIHVLDKVSYLRERVVVLERGGDVLNIYTGHSEINKDERFTPRGIATTPKDNVIVSDTITDTLHILNNAGLLMTYYKTSDINIISPWSLAFTRSKQLYIGCNELTESTTKKAKIYKVTISGC